MKPNKEAIAAENRKYKPQVLQDSEARVEELEQQLAVVRERDQTQPDSNIPDEITQLRQQLAAEREKVRPLVEVLEDVRDNLAVYQPIRLAEMIDVVLAKVKEAK